MEERIFSKKCWKCRQRAVELATVPYQIQIDHDGRKYDVFVPALSVPKCHNCQEIIIDAEADRQISDEFHRVAGLLLPDQIKAERLSLRLMQPQLAELLGVAVSTLSRWETGAQVQQRAFDRFLRAVFALPRLREFLRQLEKTPGAPLAGNTSLDPVVLRFPTDAQPPYPSAVPTAAAVD